MFRGKIYVEPGLCRRCAVGGARTPGLRAEMHAPPYADVLSRLHPGNIAKLVGLVQVQCETRVQETRRIPRHLDRAPGRNERCARSDADAVRPRREVRLEYPVAALVQHVTRVIDERGLVNAEVRAVRQLQCHRRVRERHLGERSLTVEKLVAIPAAGGDPPGRRIERHAELREFVDNLHVAIAALLGYFVAEADSVVVHAHAKSDPARRLLCLEDHEQLVEVVTDPAALAPGLSPDSVTAAALGAQDAQTGIETAVAGESQPEA